MAQRGGTSIRTKIYDKFKGVDFSTDPALVDDSRSPWAPNMISSYGSMPEKRAGWRTLLTFDSKINGIFSVEFHGVRHLLAHAGTKLYRWYEDGTSSEIAGSLNNERSTAVYMGDSLWIFTGGTLLRYDGTTCAEASANAYVPLTVISRDPAGGGTVYEPVNLLGGTQKVGFLADGSSKVYQLPYTNITRVDLVEVNGSVLSSGYDTDLNAGTVTFTTAPSAPSAGGEDNVFITFTKTIEGYSDRVNRCRVAVVWGANGASDRIIAAGNPDFPNQDFMCAYADGTYWPDTGYAVIGSSQTAILGYRRLGEYLAVVKEDNGQDSTVFIRSSAVKESGEVVFTIKPSIAGAGAVTRFGFGNIGDEQLFLSGSGVYAITTNSLTAERITQNRSFRVDPKLATEELSKAVCCSFDGNFMVFVNGVVYGLDGKQARNYVNRNDTSFIYECFYWQNVPARCVHKIIEDGREYLYFGTETGKICKFNHDIDGMSRYNDDGDAIEAIWATKFDDDGDPMVLKTMLKKGNAVTIKPYTRSGAKIYFRTDKDALEWKAAEGTMDIFDWEDIDFSRFTFNANDGPQEIPFRRKIKNYKRLQILVKNDTVNEGFGVFGIVKHFVTGNFAKK